MTQWQANVVQEFQLLVFFGQSQRRCIIWTS